jgi:hypothetical protein
MVKSASADRVRTSTAINQAPGSRLLSQPLSTKKSARSIRMLQRIEVVRLVK